MKTVSTADDAFQIQNNGPFIRSGKHCNLNKDHFWGSYPKTTPSPHKNMSNAFCKKAANLATRPRNLCSIDKQETVDLPMSVGYNMSPNISLQNRIPKWQSSPSPPTSFLLSTALAHHSFINPHSTRSAAPQELMGIKLVHRE